MIRFVQFICSTFARLALESHFTLNAHRVVLTEVWSRENSSTHYRQRALVRSFESDFAVEDDFLRGNVRHLEFHAPMQLSTDVPIMTAKMNEIAAQSPSLRSITLHQYQIVPRVATAANNEVEDLVKQPEAISGRVIKFYKYGAPTMFDNRVHDT